MLWSFDVLNQTLKTICYKKERVLFKVVPKRTFTWNQGIAFVVANQKSGHDS